MSFERVLVDRRYCSCIEVDHRYNPWWSGTWFFVTKDPISTCEEIKRFSFMTKSKSDRALLSFDDKYHIAETNYCLSFEASTPGPKKSNQTRTRSIGLFLLKYVDIHGES